MRIFIRGVSRDSSKGAVQNPPDDHLVPKETVASLITDMNTEAASKAEAFTIAGSLKSDEKDYWKRSYVFKEPEQVRGEGGGGRRGERRGG